MSMRNSRFLGKDGEREFVRFLKRWEGVEARRTKQHNGLDSPDIETNVTFRGKPIHWEVTTCKQCRVGTGYLARKFRQASVDAGDERAPLVAWKDHGKGWRISFENWGWPCTRLLLMTADADDFMRALGYRLAARQQTEDVT